eukprot:scaffold810_cov163-Amphora_coffeaeformis.AAC.6
MAEINGWFSSDAWRRYHIPSPTTIKRTPPDEEFWAEHHTIVGAVDRFVAEDHANVEAEDVPEPRTFMEEAIAFVKQCWEEGENYFTLLGKAFGVLAVAAVVNQLFFVDRSKTKKTKKKQS